MYHREFRIGGAFTNNGHSLWLCTDIGTRVVVAIRSDCTETISAVLCGGKLGPETHAIVDPRQDRSWLSGPPYGLAETVFDEYALPLLRPVADDEVVGWTPEERGGGK